MRNFDIRICSCGTIHAIPYKTVIDTCFSNENNNKDIALICGNCGKISIIGADFIPNLYSSDNNQVTYARYSYDYYLDHNSSINSDINAAKWNKPTIVIYDKGYKVPMMNRGYASHYSNEIFQDTNIPDLSIINKTNVSIDEIKAYIDKYNKDSSTVDMNRFVKSIPEEILKELSVYMIDAFDWSNTKYNVKEE